MKGRIFLVITVVFLLLANKTYAAEMPTFPSCTNPQGSTLANYADGTHGIAGDSSTHTGSDAVFQVSSNQDLQCFCAGVAGTQTNWWKVDGMSFDEINQWEKQGWIYIPDGSLWGLDPAQYLAYNMNFDCPTGTGGGGGSTGGSSSSSSNSSNSSNNSSVLGVSAPQIQGVLGAMANTGFFTDHLFSTIGALGAVLLLLALVLSKKCKKFLGLI